MVPGDIGCQQNAAGSKHARRYHGAQHKQTRVSMCPWLTCRRRSRSGMRLAGTRESKKVGTSKAVRAAASAVACAQGLQGAGSSSVSIVGLRICGLVGLPCSISTAAGFVKKASLLPARGPTLASM